MSYLLRAGLMLLAGSMPGLVSAQDIGANLQRLLPDACYLSGAYREARRMEGVAEPLEASGAFVFACDRGLIWHTATPITETLFYTTGDEHFRLDAGNNLEALRGRVQDNVARLLVGLIGADFSYLNDNFSMVEDSGAGANATVLLPRRTAMRRFVETLTLEPQDDGARLTLAGNEGDTVITISEVMEHSAWDTRWCAGRFADAQLCRHFLAATGDPADAQD